MSTAAETTRIGLLSTANINGEILAGAAVSDTVEVVAVGSRDRARAESYAAEHGLARAHGSYEDLLADPEVDAVYVSLPNGMHHEWTMHAIAAGKHVLCEKPYTRAAARGGAGVRRRRRRRRGADGGVHVPAPSADAEGA